MRQIRDPRIDPRAGDVIRQLPSRLNITVTERGDDFVAWTSRTGTNSWTIRGWQEMVAKNAQVVKRAEFKGD